MSPRSASSGIRALILLLAHNVHVHAAVSNTSASITVTPFSNSIESYTPIVFTYTNTVAAGLTETLVGPDNTQDVTFVLAGPTTFISVFTEGSNLAGEGVFAAAPPTTATQCYGTGVTTQPGRSVTYAEEVTFIPGPETVTQTTYDTSGNTIYLTSTYTAATTIFTTITTVLGPPPDTDPAGALPGEVCGGLCGACNLYYPTVNVYYWPVASPNTACLVSATTTAPANVIARDLYGYPVIPRQLNGNASTLVSNGFTFTSPSAYIVFPTISAADECGLVGTIHTDVTFPVADGQLSTVIASQNIYSTFPFDFADALCPPASVADEFHISFVGQGYRPIIAPPPGLTSIDPAWVSFCGVGDPFQGNDPPYALTPAANLSPSTTIPSALPDKTSASPSSAIPSMPAQTSTTPMFVPQPVSSPATPASASSPSPLASSTVVSSSILSLRTSYSAIATPIGPIYTLSNSQNFPPSSPVVTAGGSSGVAPPRTSPTTTTPVVISIAGQSFTANSASVWVAGTATLTAGGGAITISNTVVSLAPSASFAVVGSSTQVLPQAQSTPTPYILTLPGMTLTIIPTAVALSEKIFTFNSSAYTANSASDFLIGSQTLVPGAVVTVSGTPISLGSAATDVVVGTKTEAVGGYIISQFGGGGPTATINPFPGAAAPSRGVDFPCLVLVLGLAAGLASSLFA
ncbi:mucin 5B, oligomeric mucus gel-forming [Xylographa trunciseda]|nr:mucin 5B, oligomeric mucus gel-forming [Xylographa trunciseda]